MFEPKILDSKALIPRTGQIEVAQLPERARDPQRKLMVAALLLLLTGLGVSLYHYSDFWFPNSDEAESDQPATTAPAVINAPQQATAPQVSASPVSKLRRGAAAHARPASVSPAAPAPAPLAATATTTRTVLPPLEVEVVAGDNHRRIRPGSNSLRVDLQPGAPAQTDGSAAETAASVTSNAADRVQITTGVTDVVSRPVRPDYPLLARQMKVQGSVILQALISKDGSIQDLRVVSGPPILAAAAQDAVRQWHFKPHYEGSQPVETQAKITVNFTISTN